MGTASSSSLRAGRSTRKTDSKIRFKPQRSIVALGRNLSTISNTRDNKPLAVGEGTNAASSIFRNEDLVVLIMSFLGVRSMATFGSCSKTLRNGLAREIKRRKHVFETCKNEVKALLNDASPCRAQVLCAKRIKSSAEKLVDDELEFLQLPRQQFLCLPEYPFKEEAKQFFVANPESDDHPEFHMLPLCFYFGNEVGPSFQPSTQELVLAIDRVCNIVDLQLCTCHQLVRQWSHYEHPQYPFRKFEHPGADLFRKIMLIAASSLKYDIRTREAFRIAARKLVLLLPLAQDCLHFVLHWADQ